MFSYNTSVASEGSNVTYNCQDTESKLPLKITWSFHNVSNDLVLSENGLLAPGINKNKYSLFKSSTKLQVNNLKVRDTGNYTCCIKGEHGEILMSATGILNVKGKFTTMINHQRFIIPLFLHFPRFSQGNVSQ